MKNYEHERETSWFTLIFLAVIMLAIIGFNIYLLITYGDKPMDEVPSWVHWFWICGRGGK